MNVNRWMVALAVAVGVLLRLLFLENRTMHTDEAVHAVKFGKLLESGEYRYDKNEYHGPALNYLTVVPAKILSRESITDVDEGLLRSVPVFFGILLIPLPLLLHGLKTGAARVAVGLTAVSPAMVFYSRYYIQEMLLVFFTFGLIVSVYLLFTTKRTIWSAAAGICAGLMHATKETSLIAFGVIGIAGVIVLGLRHRGGRDTPTVSKRALLIAIATACCTSMLFYSSFFSNWAGVLESIETYRTYFDRAGNSAHIHPWYYYVQMLIGSQEKGGLFWNEATIVLFGILGIIFSIRRWRGGDGADLTMFLALYAVLMFLVYSAIPYKTPWSVLGSLHGMIIMAGVGVCEMFEYVARFRWRWLAPIFLAAVFVHLGIEAYRASFVLQENPSNPYVYAQSTKDVRELAEVIDRLSNEAPGGFAVQVVCENDDYWPLPWYLRAIHRVGWWNSFGSDFRKAAVIVVSPGLEPALLRALYEAPSPGQRELYVPLVRRPIFLRPGKEIRAYVTLHLLSRTGDMRSE